MISCQQKKFQKERQKKVTREERNKIVSENGKKKFVTGAKVTQRERENEKKINKGRELQQQRIRFVVFSWVFLVQRWQLTKEWRVNLPAECNILVGIEDGGVLADALHYIYSQVRKCTKKSGWWVRSEESENRSTTGAVKRAWVWSVSGRDVCENKKKRASFIHTTQRASFVFCCLLFCVDASECRLSVIVVPKQAGWLLVCVSFPPVALF